MCAKIYHLLDEYGNIRNVGKTTRTLEYRLAEHLYEATHGGKNHRCCWIRSMLARGLTPTIELQTEVSGDGCKAEIAYIAHYRKMGLDLVNGTDGGEGTFDSTGAIGKKISAALTGRILSPKWRKNIGLARKKLIKSGWHYPEEGKAKTIAKLTGRKRGPIPLWWKEKMRKPHKFKDKPAFIQLQHDCHVGKPWSKKRRDTFNKTGR